MFIVHVHCSLFMFIVHCSHGATLIFDDVFFLHICFPSNIFPFKYTLFSVLSKNDYAI